MKPPSPGAYRGIVVEEATPPKSVSPPGSVELRGNGWKATMPMALLVGLVSAFGARMFPAQNTVEADTRAEQRLEAMRNAEFREEMRRALAAQSDRQARLETELSSLRIVVESTRKQVERLEK